MQHLHSIRTTAESTYIGSYHDRVVSRVFWDTPAGTSTALRLPTHEHVEIESRVQKAGLDLVMELRCQLYTFLRQEYLIAFALLNHQQRDFCWAYNVARPGCSILGDTIGARQGMEDIVKAKVLESSFQVSVRVILVLVDSSQNLRHDLRC